MTKFLTNVDMNKNQILNAVEQNLATAPANPVEGQHYYNTVDKKTYTWNGSIWTTSGSEFTLNPATSAVLGGVKIGDNLNVEADGTLSIDTDSVLTADQKGVANGIASLDNNGKVPTEQLPSFVDDVVDSYIVGETPLAVDWLSDSEGGSALIPETGKIYVVLTSGEYLNKTYRWSGSVYVEISSAPGQATETTFGIAKIATTAEVTAGTDDTTIVTPAKLSAYVSDVTKKFTAQNTALTSIGGICTWTVTHNLGDDVIVSIKQVSDGQEVIADVIQGNNIVQIKINSMNEIEADTYKVVIIG